MVLLGLSTIHLLCAPHTKVEESFALHVAHDAAFGGADHLLNPPPVRRSALPPLLLSILSARPLRPLILPRHAHIDDSTMNVPLAASVPMWARALVLQLSVRFVLALAASLSLAAVAAARPHACIVFTAVCASQFHLMFYSSRLLMNTFALVPCTLALALALFDGSALSRRREGSMTKDARASNSTDGNLALSLAIVATACVCFRAELAPAVGVCWLGALFGTRHGLWTCVNATCIAIIAIGAVVYIDSTFWGTFTIPEVESAFFNVVYGGNVQWGTQPWHYYLTSALPRCVGPIIPLALIGFNLEPRMRLIGASVGIFIVSLSMIPHKELRFLLPVVPAINLAAALTVVNTQQQPWRLVAHAALIVGLVLSGLYSAVGLAASSLNYPGGSAMLMLAKHVATTPVLCGGVYVDTALAQEGVNRFLEEGFNSSCWTFFKEHSHGQLSSLISQQRVPIRYALTASSSLEMCNQGTKHLLKPIPGYKGLRLSLEQLREGSLSGIGVDVEYKGYIHELHGCRSIRIPLDLSFQHSIA